MSDRVTDGVGYRATRNRSPRPHSRAALLPLTALAAFLACSAGCADDVPQKARASPPTSVPIVRPAQVAGSRLLVVHSYHPEYPWVAAITQGIEARLAGSGVEHELFYMDTKRNTSEAWKVQAGERARQRVAEYHPDIVIAVDDDAQEYFGDRYVNTGLPLVFCGVNADPSKYGYPAANVTGIIERPHFTQTVQFARQLRPIRRLALLSCNDTTSTSAIGFMRQESVDVTITESCLVNTFDDWKAQFLRLSQSADAVAIYMYHTIKDDPGQPSLDPTIVMGWTAEHTTVPTLGFFEFGVADGLLCGVVESGTEHGARAAEYAMEILKGTPIESLPVTKATVGLKMLNRTTAQRLGLPLADEQMRDARVVGD